MRLTNIWVQDMHPVWERKRSGIAVNFPHDKIWGQFEVVIGMPRERVWDYLLQPKYRNTLIGSDRMELTNRSQGRIGPGSVYQYYHGDKLVPQTILEWEPFERMILKELFPMSAAVSWLAEYRLATTAGGTKLTKTSAKPTGPILGRTLLWLMTPVFSRITTQAVKTFGREIEDEFRAHHAGTELETEFTGEQIRAAAAEGLQASSSGQET